MKWKKVRLDLQPFRGAWRQAGSKKTTEMDASWQQIWTGAWWVELLISSLSARGITTPSLYGWSSEVRPCKPSLDEPLLDFSNSCLFSPLSTSPRRKKKTTLCFGKSLFSLTSLGHTIKQHESGKHGAEQHELAPCTRFCVFGWSLRSSHESQSILS